jgi:replicative DNA helicase
MKNSNPIIRTIDNGRATPAEKVDAWRHLREDPEVLAELKMTKAGPESAPLVTLSETVEQAQKITAREGEIVGLSTGFACIDRMTGGIGPSEIVVVFGDTSHGKSQLAQNIALNMAQREIPILFIGLEMSNAENTVRFLGMGGEADLPIIYPANMDLGYKEIDNLVGTAKQDGIQLVVLDHLHMLTRDVQNAANELSMISNELKRVARKYELPMMVISHISRQGTGKVPELRDLKGSSSIEQDADIALAVWRDMEKEEHLQTLKVVLRKNRLRGRKHTVAELAILANARLAERVEMSPFPSGR